MNILIFTHTLASGGTERVAATLANHWARRLWRVTVVTLGPASEDFYALDPQVRRLALDMAGPSSGALDALAQNLRRVAALRRVLVEQRPAVAVAMMSTPNVLLAFAAWGLPGLCTIGSEHCYPPHRPLGRIWTALCRRMYGRLGAVVALTQECAQWIRAHSSATRVPVIPNAAPWPLPQQAPYLAPDAVCAPGRRILLAVGRLETVKNLELLLQVFARLAPAHPDWDLVILGEGSQRPALERTIDSLLPGTRIQLPGTAGNVGQWYARADLYVMSSRSEGFPNSLAEALAHGLPAVSFDCDTGPRDIIRHGVDGLLVPPDDAAALMRALGCVMADARLRARFAARAAEARERFSLERVAGMWEDLFRELTARRPAARPAGGLPGTEGRAP
ncbi:MAG: glycosyltransferase family 4 protein [Lysobacteraceae bacterium]|nr:MAG: glycosyltransferase family 4 protein [Xanthomonadaceae bacterium]